MRLWDVARERQQQRHRVLGGRHHVRLWSVGDDDSVFGGGLDVHVVDAHTRTADHPQVAGAVDQLRRHLRGRADQDAVIGADTLGELVIAPLDPHLDVEVLAQQIDAGLADLLLDEHLQAPVAIACIGGVTHAEILSTIQSMQAVSACTSAGSTAGNIPTRS